MTAKRQARLSLEHNFNIECLQLYDAFQISFDNKRYTKDEIIEKNVETLNNVVKNVKKDLYKSLVKEFNKHNIKQYWIHIEIKYGDNGINDKSYEGVFIKCFDFLYNIDIKISNHDLNRLKLSDYMLYNALLDNHRFKRLFGRILSN